MPQLYDELAEASTNDESSGWFPPDGWSEEDDQDYAEFEAISAIQRLEPSRRHAMLERLIAETENAAGSGVEDDGIPLPG